MIVHVSRLTEPDTREPADPTTHHAQEKHMVRLGKLIRAGRESNSTV